MEQDISSIEKRFAYGFLQKLLKWMDIAQEFIAHLGAKACYGSFLSLFSRCLNGVILLCFKQRPWSAAAGWRSRHTNRR